MEYIANSINEVVLLLLRPVPVCLPPKAKELVCAERAKAAAGLITDSELVPSADRLGGAPSVRSHNKRSHVVSHTWPTSQISASLFYTTFSTQFAH